MSELKPRSWNTMHNANPLEKASQGERASLTSQDAPDSTDADVNGKRKTPPLHTGNRFKAVGTMVLAMRRFQGELRARAAPREALAKHVVWQFSCMVFASAAVPHASISTISCNMSISSYPAASLNPTVTFGKQTSSAGGSVSSSGAASQVCLLAAVENPH